MKDLFKDTEKRKDNIFIRDDLGNTINYQEAFNYTDKVKKIVDERCLVFLLTKNTVGGLMNYFMCLKNKIVPFMLSANSDRNSVERLLNIYNPKYIIIPNNLINDYKDFEEVHTEYDYSILKTNYNEKTILHDDLCMLVSTSGSTGTEKLVRLSYENIYENVLQRLDFMNKNFKYNNVTVDWNEFRSMLLMPINYSYVLCAVNTTIYTGASLLLSDKKAFDKEFWEFFIKGRSNSLFGIPLHCQILDKIGYFQMPNDYLKYVTIAGASLSSDLFDKCMKFSKDNNIVFDIGYGQTEASAVISELETDKMIEKKGSIGKGQLREKLYLVDDNDNIIEKPNTLGELVVNGKNVALGYATSKKDLSKGNDFKGILHTGDMATFDEDGYFYIKGRKARFVNIYASRINLDDIESLIKNRYNDIDIACIGQDNSITILTNDREHIEEIELFVLNKLKLNKKVLQVKYIDKILKNESGKTLYSKMSELYL